MAEFQRLLRYGNPGPTHDIGNRLAFASCYDRRMRNPAWVASLSHILSKRFGLLMERSLKRSRKQNWRRGLVIARIVCFLKIQLFQKSSVQSYLITFAVDMIEVIRCRSANMLNK